MTFKTFRRGLLQAAGVLVLSVVIAASGVGRAIAEHITPVLVVNGPSQPVPVSGSLAVTDIPGVQQSGEWNVGVTTLPDVHVASLPNVAVSSLPSVAVSSLPAVSLAGTPQVACQQSGTWTVQLAGGSAGSGSTQVTNTADNPVNVRDVAPSHRQYFTHSSSASNSIGGVTSSAPEFPIAFIFVPDDKRFVLEQVMATVAPANAGPLSQNFAGAYLSISQTPTELPYSFNFIPLTHQGELYQGRQLFVGSQQVHIVIPPGGAVQLIASQRGGSDAAGRGILSGYYEDI